MSAQVDQIVARFEETQLVNISTGRRTAHLISDESDWEGHTATKGATARRLEI